MNYLLKYTKRKMFGWIKWNSEMKNERSRILIKSTKFMIKFTKKILIEITNI